MSSSRSVTQQLVDWGNGDRASLDALIPVVYNELRRIAESFLRHERLGHTLQPTALVHEAYLRLIDQKSVNWQNRAQFFGIAAQMMRRILVNHAQSRHADKRGGHATRLSLDDAVSFFEERDVNLIALNEALIKLTELDPKQSQIVEFRFFGGLTLEETAEVLEVSTATIKREWGAAKLWLLRELKQRELISP